jgi:hypothetical protein
MIWSIAMALATLLRLNGVSCLGFGAVFLLGPGAVAAFLGAMPPWVLVALGVGLLGNGLHLFAAARRRPKAWEIRWFSAGDAAWVGLTLGILAAGAWITTPPGQAAAAAVAVGVGALGALQWQSRATHQDG